MQLTGTVLDHTDYNAVHFSNPDGAYPTVVARLNEAGASLAPLSRPSGHDTIDAIPQRHGAFR